MNGEAGPKAGSTRCMSTVAAPETTGKAASRIRYERRLRTLDNRRDWALVALDRVRARVRRVELEIEALEAEYADLVE